MEALRGALRTADEATVARLLDANPTLLQPPNVGKLLDWAVNRQHVHVVSALAQRGVSLEAVTGMKSTPLQKAAEKGYEGVVRVLLEHGADASNEGSTGMPPLFIAMQGYRMGMVKLLLQHLGGRGLDEGCMNREGKTALGYAACRGLHDMVRLLLEHGADPRVRDVGVGNRTPLMHAAYWGDVCGARVVQALMPHLQRQDLNAVGGPYGLRWTALHHACAPSESSTGPPHLALLTTLLLAGADWGLRDGVGRTPRELAMQYHRHVGVRGAMLAVFQWWDGELERRYLLYRVWCLHNSTRTRRDQPTSQVPTYLEARVAAGHAVPRVEVLKTGAPGKRSVSDKAQEEEEEEEERLRGVLEFVVKGLREDLLSELLECLHKEKGEGEAQASRQGSLGRT